MIEFKGTPGEWICVFTSDNSRAVRSDGGIISILPKPSRYANQDERYERELKESHANQLLISKAPEMFEMLKEAMVTIQRLKLTMLVHPDCTEGSEFDDYTTEAQEMEDEIEILLKK